jgi:hypothetical protein
VFCTINRWHCVCSYEAAGCAYLLCYWLLIDKQMYLIQRLSATLCARCIGIAVASVDVGKRFIHLADVAFSWWEQLISTALRHDRLFILTASRHDTTVYINGTTSWQAVYINSITSWQAVYINSITSWYGCLYQQHYVTIRLFISTTLRHDRLFISTALRHDTAVYINGTTSWQAVYINSTTSWYGCLYQRHYVMTDYINSTTSW